MRKGGRSGGREEWREGGGREGEGREAESGREGRKEEGRKEVREGEKEGRKERTRIPTEALHHREGPVRTPLTLGRLDTGQPVCPSVCPSGLPSGRRGRGL